MDSKDHLTTMFETADGQHAIQADPDHQQFGWVFYKHAAGHWVTLRRALPQELAQVTYRARLRKIEADGGERGC